MSSEEPQGKVTDYFWKRDTVRIEVLNGKINDGDTLNITGEYTDVTIEAQDMTVDDETVNTAEEGDIFAMPLEPQDRVVLGDEVHVSNANE
jgi:hypothetical protein